MVSERYPDVELNPPSYSETAVPPDAAPVVRQITTDTVKDCLRKGIEDFRAQPGFGLFFGGIYFVGGLVLWAVASAFGNSGVLVPLAFAFPLLGPFIAIGLYEVSRRRAAGEGMSRPAVLGALFRQRDGQMPFMGVIILFLTLSWLILVRVTFAIFLSDSAMTNIFSTREALFTPEGIVMLLVVGVMGFAFAVLVFSITVVSMPMMLEREIDFVTAMITSVQAVTENLKPMAMWAGIVAATMLVAMLPAFIGLVIALPVLGHATWHLYKAVVE